MRAISLPFLDPFPKPEILDAAASADPAFFRTEEGALWLPRIEGAQKDARRFTDAAATARARGDFPQALKMERREARRLERLADEGTNPRERVLVYRRILNAYPTYKNVERVRSSLADAEIMLRTQATVTVAELAAHPGIPEALGIPATLFDGIKSNGEIGRDGLAVLSHDAVVYTDRAAGRRIELPLEDGRRIEALRRLEPIRRTGALDTVLRQPGSRKKVPIALEAGVFPGFDIAPELVPLEPDRKERELYR